jgi:hypothetical protein
MKEDLEGEIWKDITGYEGIYQISNMGRVYSLPKDWIGGSGGKRFHNGKLLKEQENRGGYLYVNLYKNSKLKKYKTHQIVAMMFLNHIPCGYNLVVDHINNVKTDNRLSNLQLLSNRDNIHKSLKSHSSKYIGTHYNKNRSRWVSQIYINGKIKHLGSFDCELKAHLAYKQAIKEIQNATL